MWRNEEIGCLCAKQKLFNLLEPFGVSEMQINEEIPSLFIRINAA
jgi:hypothetical protein